MEKPLLDIAANRKARKWSAPELFRRALWEVLRIPLFAWSPRPLWSWRCMILRLFGASIGSHVHIYPSVRIALPWNLEIGDYAAVGEGAILYSLGRIVMGKQVTVSQYAHLCAGTHDYTMPDMPLVKSPVTVHDGAWICADAFIGPGVTVGRFAIVGARAVAVKDVAESAIVAGEPGSDHWEAIRVERWSISLQSNRRPSLPLGARSGASSYR